MRKTLFSSQYSRIVATLAIGILWSGCGRAQAPATAERTAPKEQPAAEQPSEVPHAREADDAARFLAGLPGRPGTPFAELEQTDAWKSHRSSMDAAWDKANTALVSKLKLFSEQELKDPRWASPVFYPFGGPDSLTVALLFPRSPKFTFVALEPSGTLPSVAKFQKMDQKKYLAETRETMAAILGKSFFITRDMDKQFRGQITDGLLLPILQLLVRTDHKVLGFRYVRLDEKGEIIDRTENYTAPTRYGNKGVELEFETEADSSVHKLFYFSVNLQDDRMAENKPFQAFLAQTKGVTTFLKSTSYMTHHKEFAMIRNGILAVSSSVLQDDSGIPYAAFRPELWDVQLYGEYTQPYGSFKWLEQPDLRKAYVKPGVKPLPLRLGYGYGKVASNLLMATRRN
jgi:hypothetical protein